MKKHIHFCALLFITTTLTSCSSAIFETNNKSNNAQACNVGKVRLTANFAAGRMNDCKITALNVYLVTLIPENTPINSSPWYAFKVEADQPTQITIVMKVKGDKHRYPPKVSADGKIWNLQEHQLDNGTLTMQIDVNEQPTYIAAQEIINNQFYVDWGNKLKNNNTVTHSILGQSTQNRPIYKIESKSEILDESKEWLVILGRQHPPEVTGALALFPFVNNLLSNSQLAQDFREQYNILVIPNVNPDGVAMGNWRSNANGIDLNRDWIKFSQVETKLIDNYLKALLKQGHKIKFAVDFHSTKHDVFYTMPVDYGVEDKYFAIHWLAALDKLMPNFKVVTQPGNTPNNGVSKQYFSDNFNIHAITYEVGDDTNRHAIEKIAFNASKALMATMLSNIDHDIKDITEENKASK